MARSGQFEHLNKFDWVSNKTRPQVKEIVGLYQKKLFDSHFLQSKTHMKSIGPGEWDAENCFNSAEIQLVFRREKA